MSEVETAAAPVGLGSRLAAAREEAGLSLPEAAEQLHLDAATLQGLEREQFHTLGAAVYVRGHLRRYAELLRLPVAEIEAAYGDCSTAVSGMPDLRRVAMPLQGAASPSWTLRPGPAIVVASLLAIAALFWWAMRMPHASRAVSTAAAGPAEAGAVVPGAVVPGGGVPGGGAPATAAGATPDPASTTTSGAAASAAPVLAPVAAAHPPASVTAVAVPATGGLPAGSVRLALQFRESSWVEIYDAGGVRLLYELAPAGSERALRGGAPLRILLGNPSGVDLTVDGRPVTFDEPPRGDSPVRLSLDGSGRVLEVRAAVTAGAGAGPDGVPP